MKQAGQAPEGSGDNRAQQYWGQGLQCELGKKISQKVELDEPTCSLEGRHQVDTKSTPAQCQGAFT